MKFIPFVLILWFFYSCTENAPAPQDNDIRVETLSLSGPAADNLAELSSLCWAGDTLILMPENPETYSAGHFYFLRKEELRAGHPLSPGLLAMNLDWIGNIGGYEGFEALLVEGNTLYALLEAREEGRMKSWIIKGRFSTPRGSILWDGNSLRRVPVPDSLRNLSAEALTLFRDTLYVFAEANGRNVNRHPEAWLFDMDLKFLGTKPFPAIEYRVTDATRCDARGYFWIMNYFFPGEQRLVRPAEENLIPAQSPSPGRAVERMIYMRITADSIIIADKNTFSLPVTSAKGRNWEGLALTGDRRFIAVTDQFPHTLLALIYENKQPSAGE